ncbi:hypothetical protein [Pararobbsia alpina]|uniref:Uncharacterized protein n=1 Tax=Pararobbsia alpina TaxID=621374 RepID=A0A6S7CKR2_9BURK|nr:hypothetical protein [Pararobbsia alpina]CAB3782173.1 hypothetical protein LMG28138_01456 [Pararobbsia alpina]
MHLVHSMVYTGQTPWHGLGNQLAADQPLEVWAQQARMNWKIEESEVRFAAGAADIATRQSTGDPRGLGLRGSVS